ncbi:outer membrane protein transport protein, partial [Acinetobacter baumannii]
MTRLSKLPRLTAAALFAPALAWSAGAEVPVIAISSQGTSNANSAEARDPSVIFYNPAGMSRLRGTNVSSAFALAAATTKVEDTGTTRLQDMGQTPDTGNSANCSVYDCMSAANPNPAMPAVRDQPEGLFPAVLPVAALFGTTPLSENVTLGIGIFSPGGGNLNYKKDWFGRHFIDSAAIETVNINPSLAIRFDDKHSIGL